MRENIVLIVLVSDKENLNVQLKLLKHKKY